MSKTFANTAGNNTNLRDPKRVIKGVPGAGRFDFENKSESFAVTLLADERAQRQEETAALLAEYITPDDLVKVAYESASLYHVRYGVRSGGQHKSNTHDVDDTAQDAMVATLEALHRGNKITSINHAVNSIAANMTVRHATANKFRAEDRKAYRQFTALVSEEQLRKNRQLTQREQDEIAQNVLDDWHDPRHKPSKDFRTPITVDLSLDRPLGDDGGTEINLGSSLTSPESSGHYIEPDSFMDRAFTAHEKKGSANKAEAKRLAWNAFAERAEAPLAVPASLSQRQVTNHRKIMESHKGGVMSACEDWSNAVSNEAVESLFAPFGKIDESEQEKVVSLFENFGEDKAQAMWESAIGYANNKHGAGEAA